MEKNQALTIPKKTTDAISTNLSKIQWILPKDISLDRFRAGLWLQFGVHERLAECTPTSIVRAIVKAAQKGLEPGRDCCILPFKNRKGNYYEAQMIEEYQGVLRRLDRTGRVAWAKAEAVFSRDHFICDELAEQYEFRRHLGGDRGNLICYFSAVKLHGYDKPLVRVCTIEEVEEVKVKMGRQEYEAWVKWPHEMGKKTAIKKHAKMLNLVDDGEEEEPAIITDEQAQKNIADMYGDDVTRRIPDMTAVKAPSSDLNSQETSQDPGNSERATDDSEHSQSDQDVEFIAQTLGEIKGLANKAGIPMEKLATLFFDMWQIKSWDEVSHNQISGLLDQISESPGELMKAVQSMDKRKVSVPQEEGLFETS